MKTYEALYEPDKNKGVYGISLVENPAMEGLFIALAKEEVIQFKEVDKEQRILTGLALEPNKPIPRNQNGEKFNLIFSENTVKELAFGFLKNGYQKSSSLEHENKITGVTFTESWIIEDAKNDKSNALGFNYPKGSWMVTMKVDDDSIWNDYIKTGKVQGFSIDAMLSLKEVKLSKNQTVEGLDIWFKDTMLIRGDEVTDLEGNFLPNGTHELMTNVEIDVVNGIVTDMREVNLKSEIKMSKPEENSIIEMLKNLPERIMIALKGEQKPTEVKLGEVTTKDGNTKIMYDGDTPEVGGKAWVLAEDGTEVPLPIGDYPLEDERILVIAEVGVIAEVKEATTEEAPAEQKPAEMTVAETDATAKAIENAIKSIMIKYSEDHKKEMDDMKAELKTANDKLIELSNQPATTPRKSVPTPSEPTNAKQRLFQELQKS